MGLESFKRSSDATAEDRYNEWLATCKPRTQELYKIYMAEFTAWLGEDLNSIIAFHRDDCLKGEGDTLHRAFTRWLDYAQTERAVKLSRVSAEYYLKPLNKAIEANHLPKLKIKYIRSHPNAKTLLQLDQMRFLISQCGTSKRKRALIYSLKDTGLRVSDLAQLTIEDYLGAQRHYDEDGREFRVWKNPIVTEKMGVLARVHLGYEAIEAINDYIGDRTSGAIFILSKGNIGAPMSGSAITQRMSVLTRPLKAQGFDVSAHSFRKSFLSFVIPKGLIEPMAKMIVGKLVPQTDSTYYVWESQLTEAYMMVYPEALALENKERDERKIQKLETDMKKLAQGYVDSNEALTQIILDLVGDDMDKLNKYEGFFKGNKKESSK